MLIWLGHVWQMSRIYAGEGSRSDWSHSPPEKKGKEENHDSPVKSKT